MTESTKGSVGNIAEISAVLKTAFAYVQGYPLFIFTLAYTFLLLPIVMLGGVEKLDYFVYLIYFMPVWAVVVYVMQERVFRGRPRSLLQSLTPSDRTIFETRAMMYGVTEEQLATFILSEYVRKSGNV